MKRLLALAFFPGSVALAEGRGGVSDTIGTGGLLQVFLSLILVLLLIAGLAYVLRRFGRLQPSGSGSLRVVGGLQVGQRERVVLIQVGDRQLLLGVAPGRVQTLHILEEPLDLQAGGNQVPFADRLSSLMKNKGGS